MTPCPFCGANPLTHEHHDEITVTCPTRKCPASFSYVDASIWNRRTVSGQEAIGEVRGNGVQWFDQNPHAYPVGTKFYATPIPATEPK
jgi:hypothetical protein